jgi:glycerophosphoryl diester phosphodiesterase
MTRCVGHRGAAALAPENTLLAFEVGIAAGADAVECDVHMTRDGQLVVMHDADVSRTTDGKGRIGGLALEDLRRLNAAATWPRAVEHQRPPTLIEVLALARGRCAVQVEIKVPDGVPYPGIEAAVVAALRDADAGDSAQVICFHGPTLRRVRELAPTMALGFLASRSSLPGELRRSPLALVGFAGRCGATFLGLERQLVAAEHGEAARSVGMGLAVWTVNAPREMERLAHQGVDAITSDRPDLLRAVLDRLAQDRSAGPQPQVTTPR